MKMIKWFDVLDAKQQRNDIKAGLERKSKLGSSPTEAVKHHIRSSITYFYSDTWTVLCLSALVQANAARLASVGGCTRYFSKTSTIKVCQMCMSR